jgi:hypothetical protein
MREWIDLVENFQLNELFDDHQKWSWHKTEPGQWIATFNIGDIPYYVTFAGFNAISITFAAITKTERGSGANQGITGTRGAGQVFATVLEIVRAFLAKRHPREFGFEAKKSQPSRVRLYRKMVTALGDVPGYVFEENDADNPHHDAVSFLFTRTDNNNLAEKAPAGALAPLYHFTTFKGARGILETGEIYSSGGSMPPVISVTRDKNLQFYQNTVRLDFDTAKIRHNYKIVPHNYWPGGASARTESEERIIASSLPISVIKNITLLPSHRGHKSIDRAWFAAGNEIIELAAKQGIPLIDQRKPIPDDPTQAD